MRSKSSRRRNPVRPARVIAEACEPRVLFSTYVVTNGHDSGPGTLRQAILNANLNAGSSIVFNIPESDFSFDATNEIFQIVPTGSPLPAITSPTTIDGSSEYAFLPIDPFLNPDAPLIFIAGAFAGSGVDGLHVTANGCFINDLSIGDFANSGIYLDGASSTVVQRCWLGVDPTGAAAANGIDGVAIANGAAANVIGAESTSPTGSGNLIDYNRGYGVEIRTNAHSNLIAGDLIGVQSNGLGAAGNLSGGVLIHAASANNQIGGAASGQRNTISANGGPGVTILDAGSSGNMIQDNLIGLTTGFTADGNATDGVLINGAPGNVIGSALGSVQPNLISSNHRDGVRITGAAATGNLVADDNIGTNSNASVARGNAANGVTIDAPGNSVGASTVFTFVSGNLGAGIEITAAATHTTVTSCQVGISDTRNTTGGLVGGPLGNAGPGILLEGGGNTIGTTGLFPSNVISANGTAGILVSGVAATGNTVYGNSIGSNVPASAQLPNHDGVSFVFGASNNTLTNNVISGNTAAGVQTDTTSGANHLNGNRIGTNANGDRLGNGAQGVLLRSSGNEVNVQNFIAFNGGAGISIDGPVSGNDVYDDSIHDNGGLAIDLNDDGVTLNTPGGPHAGPDHMPNFPILTAAATNGTGVGVSGTLNTTPSALVLVEFYASPTADPSGYGEGQLFLQEEEVRTDASGNAGFSFTFTPPSPVPTGWVVSAYTNVSGTGGGVGEFSRSIPIADQTHPPTVVAATYDYLHRQHSLSFRFSQDMNIGTVPSIASGITVHNLTSASDAAPVSFSYDVATRTATWAFSGPLDDGNYRATLNPAVVKSLSGLQLDGNGDGTQGDPYTFSFFFLTGDLNHDGSVNFTDLLNLAQHYGQTTGFANGDLDYSGTVAFADLLLLAQHYNQHLSSAGAAATGTDALDSLIGPGGRRQSPRLLGR